MALTSTLYRFQLKLSDIDRDIYEGIELRVAMHPSESIPFLLTRVIAYALNLQEGLTFTQGIGSPDEPTLQVKDLTGLLLTWIDIGNPTARRLHKASKSAKRVRVYTYRDPAILLTELAGEEIHARDTIEIFSLSPKFLDRLSEFLERDNAWELLHDNGELSISAKGKSVHGELLRHSLSRG